MDVTKSGYLTDRKMAMKGKVKREIFQAVGNC